MTRRRLVAALIGVVVVGCTPSGSATSSAPAASGSSVDGGGLLPEGCESIDLLSPDGERIDLTGMWEGEGALVDSGETVWLTQVGKCVYGSAANPEFLSQAQDELWTLVNIQGHLTSDFRMPSTAVIVLQHDFMMAVTSAVTFLIEWDDTGQIQLREDREPGEIAARCRPLPFACPAPLILHRADDAAPAPSPA